MIGEQFCNRFGIAGWLFFQPERELGMPLGTANTRDIVVDHVAYQHMLEAVYEVLLNGRAYLLLSFNDEFMLDQYMKRLENSIAVKVRGQFDNTSQPEGTSDNGSVLEHLLLNLAQQVDARGKHALYSVGQAGEGQYINLVQHRIMRVRRTTR